MNDLALNTYSINEGKGLDLRAAPKEELFSILDLCCVSASRLPWFIGDVLLEIEGRIEDGKEDEAEYKRLERWARENKKTGTDLFEYKAVCLIIAAEHRRDLSFDVHKTILIELKNKRDLFAESINRWLDYAEQQKAQNTLTLPSLREAIKGDYKQAGSGSTPPIPSLTTVIRPFRKFRESVKANIDSMTREQASEILSDLKDVSDFIAELKLKYD